MGGERGHGERRDPGGGDTGEPAAGAHEPDRDQSDGRGRQTHHEGRAKSGVRSREGVADLEKGHRDNSKQQNA